MKLPWVEGQPGELTPTPATGSTANSPIHIPARGWWQVLRRALSRVMEHHLPLLAAGVAFFGFLALFPALIALVTLVGLVAEPMRVTEQLRNFTVGLPQNTEQLITDQLTALAETSDRALTIGLVVSLLVALWTVSMGTSYLMMAVNLAYGEQETRSFVRLRAVALLLTVGAVVFLAVTLALIAVVPAVVEVVPLGPIESETVLVLRWVLLVALIVAGLGVLYRIGPNRRPARLQWVTLGSVVAALLWLVGSAGFNLYITLFGHYNQVYGALGAVMVLMLWLFLTSFVVLLGAQINAETERQTTCDTTVGPTRPMGERGAVVADSLPE